MAEQVAVVDQAGGVEIPAGFVHFEGIPVTLRAPIVVDVSAANHEALTEWVASKSGVKAGRGGPSAGMDPASSQAFAAAIKAAYLDGVAAAKAEATPKAESKPADAKPTTK